MEELAVDVAALPRFSLVTDPEVFPMHPIVEIQTIVVLK